MRERAERFDGRVPRHPVHPEERTRKARADRTGFVDREHPSLLDQRHAVATVGLVHVGRGDDDREPRGLQVVQQVPELAARDGVDAGGRFVEEQEFGPMHERAREGELLLHATRELPRATVLESFDLLVDRRDDVVALFERRAEDRGEEAQILLDAQVGVEREATRHVADALADLPEVADHVAAKDRRGAGVGYEECGDDPEQRRLAATVGTHEPEQLTSAHVEGHLVERDRAAKDLADPVEDDGRRRRAHGTAAAAMNVRSAGMPILSTPSLLATRTFTA